MSINQRHLNEFHGWLLKVDSSSWRPVRVSNAFVWEAAVCNYPTGRARIREPMYRQLCHTSVPILLFNLISSMPMDVLGHFDRPDRISSLFFRSVCQLTCICVRARTTMISRLKHRVADIEVALRTWKNSVSRALCILLLCKEQCVSIYYVDFIVALQIITVALEGLSTCKKIIKEL